MKTVVLSIVTLLLSLNVALAQDGFSSRDVVEEKSAPRFENYRVIGIFRGKPAPVKSSSLRARMFRTRLRENAKDGVDFAGHYILATWGCGSGCSSIAIIDARTGRVYFTPSLLLVGTALYQELAPLEFRKDSRLLKVVGSRNDEEVGTFYYVWRNNRLKLVRAYRNKQVK